MPQIIPIKDLKNTSDNIDVYQQLAKEKNISETQVENSIKNGIITRDEVISATLNTVQQESEDNTTYNDLASEWQNSLNQLKTAEGEGYNTKRKEQLEKNIQFFNENGEKLSHQAPTLYDVVPKEEITEFEELIRKTIADIVSEASSIACWVYVQKYVKQKTLDEMLQELPGAGQFIIVMDTWFERLMAE